MHIRFDFQCTHTLKKGGNFSSGEISGVKYCALFYQIMSDSLIFHQHSIATLSGNFMSDGFPRYWGKKYTACGIKLPTCANLQTTRHQWQCNMASSLSKMREFLTKYDELRFLLPVFEGKCIFIVIKRCSLLHWYYSWF